MGDVRMAPWIWTFIENLAANWTAELFGPTTMIAWLITLAVVIYGVIAWHRRQRTAKKLGMASWQFIALCFAIALIAVAGGAYGLGLKFASNAADASQDVTTKPNAPPQAEQTLNRKYRAADAPKLLPLLQQASDIVDTGTLLARDLVQFNNGLRAQVQKDGSTQPSIVRLGELRDRARDLSVAVNKLEAASGLYSEDIRYVLDATRGDFSAMIAQEADNWMRRLTAFATPPNQAAFEVMQGEEQRFAERAQMFLFWISHTQVRVQELNRKLSAAE
jgi:hypothetical protein